MPYECKKTWAKPIMGRPDRNRGGILQRNFYLAQNRATAARGPEKAPAQHSDADGSAIEFADEIQALIIRAGLDDYLDANPAVPLRLHERALWLAEHAYTNDDVAARH